MRKHIYIIGIMMLLPLAVFGQALRGSYFFDSSIQRMEMNPAFSTHTNYINIVELSANVNSNLGAKNFLFPKDGQLYPYLNQNVSTAEFMALMPQNPYVQGAIDANILGAGFYISDKEYITVDIGERTNMRMDTPTDFYLFLKDAGIGQTYNIKDFSIYQDAYIQVAGGYKRDLGDVVPGLSIGAKAKFLMGIDRVDMRINNARIYMSESEMSIISDAEGSIHGKFVDYVAAAGEDQLPSVEFGASGIGIAGYGFAVDLGVDYKLKFDDSFVDGINLSASLVDLGAIFYSSKDATALKSQGTASFTGFEEISKDFNASEALKRIGAEFLTIANFEETPGTGITSTLTPKAFVGVEVPMMKNFMSVGLLYSYMYGISDITASYNLKVAKKLNVGLNYSFLNTFKTIGWIVEFVPYNGVALFVGSDYTSFANASNGIPVDKAVVNGRIGIQAVFGSKYFKK